MVNALVWNSLAEYYFICHRDERAIKAYESTLQLDPINKEALQNHDSKRSAIMSLNLKRLFCFKTNMVSVRIVGKSQEKKNYPILLLLKSRVTSNKNKL